MDKPRKEHWDSVYENKDATEVSWYQPIPTVSLRLIVSSGVSPTDPIIDIGGGASTLVDGLLDRGFRDVSVLDVAAGAFDQSRARLGARAQAVRWIESDVTAFEPQRRYRVWHDRAALHFLTGEKDRDRYVDALNQALEPDGFLVLATFGPDGPPRCSGLEIRRYNVRMMAELLGSAFELQTHELESHVTPSGGSQQFLYTRWKRRG